MKLLGDPLFFESVWSQGKGLTMDLSDKREAILKALFDEAREKTRKVYPGKESHGLRPWSLMLGRDVAPHGRESGATGYARGAPLTGDHDLSQGSLKEIKPECKEETMKESKKLDYQSPEWVDRFDHDILEIQSAVQLASDMLFFKSHDVRPESVGVVLDSACKKLDSLKKLVEGVWQSILSDKMDSSEEKEKKVLEAQEVK